jgi:hypothetical protein
MPIPITRPDDTSSPHTDEYYLRQQEDWATYQERMRHEQALYQVGEYSMFILMWSLIDFEEGLVVRCTRCYGTTGTIQQRVANVYNQPTQNECPDCYGTTFEGGIRAKIVRPTIWADQDEKEKLAQRGVVHPERVSVESTWDFRMRQGDFILRADGSRWRVPTGSDVTDVPPDRGSLRGARDGGLPDPAYRSGRTHRDPDPHGLLPSALR